MLLLPGWAPLLWLGWAAAAATAERGAPKTERNLLLPPFACKDGAGFVGSGGEVPSVRRRNAQTLENHTRSSFTRMSTECHL